MNYLRLSAALCVRKHDILIHLVYWLLAGRSKQNARHTDIDYESLPDLENAQYYQLPIQCELGIIEEMLTMSVDFGA